MVEIVGLETSMAAANAVPIHDYLVLNRTSSRSTCLME